jgi:hypothetical protein
MKLLAISLFILSATTTVYAKKIAQMSLKKSGCLKEGYIISKFKQPGTCYEIYGTNKEGKKVEIYFNPVDSSIVKSK